MRKTARIIRFGLLAAFAGLFAWLTYVRGEALWLLPAIVFVSLALATLSRRP